MLLYFLAPDPPAVTSQLRFLGGKRQVPLRMTDDHVVDIRVVPAPVHFQVAAAIVQVEHPVVAFRVRFAVVRAAVCREVVLVNDSVRQIAVKPAADHPVVPRRLHLLVLLHLLAQQPSQRRLFLFHGCMGQLVHDFHFLFHRLRLCRWWRWWWWRRRRRRHLLLHDGFGLWIGRRGLLLDDGHFLLLRRRRRRCVIVLLRAHQVTCKLVRRHTQIEQPRKTRHFVRVSAASCFQQLLLSVFSSR
mmetsp:Transcript_25939/g.65404  ORF Transcript_25939/g.65404 Transcript_25939/m.65404 type:complete len:244 (+) Transcript_25939:898-1629(+)